MEQHFRSCKISDAVLHETISEGQYRAKIRNFTTVAKSIGSIRKISDNYG